MGSESLFVKCGSCGKDISKSVKSCPHCGEKQKRLSIIHWIGIVFLVLIVIGLLADPEPVRVTKPIEKEGVVTEMPQDQAQFVNTINAYADRFRAAKNELQQSVLRDGRRDELAGSMRSYSVSSWVGTISQLETNTEGKAVLVVKISPSIEIKTWNNALSDLGSNTLIEKHSELYRLLFDLSPGQKVRFSGRFFSSETDHIEETSLTIQGAMNNPEFLFRFDSVTPIN